MKAVYNPNTRILTVEEERITRFAQIINFDQWYYINDKNGNTVLYAQIRKTGKDEYTFDFEELDDDERGKYNAKYGEYFGDELLGLQELEVVKYKNPLKVPETTADIFHLDMQEVIINDIKEMDSDALKYLIEHMYPVHADFNDDCETIKITVDFQEAPGADLEDIF